MALAAIFSALFAMIAEIGLGSTLVQANTLTPKRLRQVLAVVLLSNVTVGLFMAGVVAPLVASFFGEPRLQLVVQVIALQFFASAFAVIPAAMLEREMKFRRRAIVDFVSTLGGALVTLALAYWGLGVFALAWGTVALATIRAIGLNIAFPFSGTPIFEFSGCGSMFNFGRNVAATQFVWFFYSQADAFIVGKLLGKHDLGLYSVSMDLASLPASRISAILNQVVFPSLAKVKRDGGSVGPHLLRGFRAISLASFPIMWGISCVAPELVRTALGEQWTEAVMPLMLLCLIMPLRVLSPLVHSGLHAVGRADVSFRITCITAAAMCTAFLVGAHFGLLGLSVAWLSVFPLVFVSNIVRCSKYLGVSAGELIAALGRPGGACLLMYAAVALARPTLQWPHAVNLVVLVAVGVVAYAAFTFVFNRQGLREVVGLFRRLPE